MKTFKYNKQTLEPYDHPYNSTILNERAVEISIVLEWLDGQDREADGLEVGNVMSHYGSVGHRVVDLTEVAPGVENLDLFDITGEYDWVLAISTIEHVKWEASFGYEAGAGLKALSHLKSLVRPGGSLLVTVPMGYNPPLDQAIVTGKVQMDSSITFVNDSGNWRQTRKPESRPYGPWANSVWIGEWKA